MHALPNCLSRQSLHNEMWNYQPESKFLGGVGGGVGGLLNNFLFI